MVSSLEPFRWSRLGPRTPRRLLGASQPRGEDVPGPRLPSAKGGVAVSLYGPRVRPAPLRCCAAAPTGASLKVEAEDGDQRLPLPSPSSLHRGARAGVLGQKLLCLVLRAEGCPCFSAGVALLELPRAELCRLLIPLHGAPAECSQHWEAPRMRSRSRPARQGTVRLFQGAAAPHCTTPPPPARALTASRSN